MDRAVQLVYIIEDKVLAVTRKPDHKLWTFPAGKVEFNEDLLEAIEREVKEETNSIVSNLKILSYEVYDRKEQFAFTGKAIPILDNFIAEDKKNGSACFVTINEFINNSAFTDYNKRVLKLIGIQL